LRSTTRAPALKSGVLYDYDGFIAATGAAFEQLRQSGGLATSEEVAEVIWVAATDGSNQLRYVATDDIKPLIEKRRESSEHEYIAFMRERMTAKLR